MEVAEDLDAQSQAMVDLRRSLGRGGVDPALRGEAGGSGDGSWLPHRWPSPPVPVVESHAVGWWRPDPAVEDAIGAVGGGREPERA